MLSFFLRSPVNAAVNLLPPQAVLHKESVIKGCIRVFKEIYIQARTLKDMNHSFCEY